MLLIVAFLSLDLSARALGAKRAQFGAEDANVVPVHIHETFDSFPARIYFPEASWNERFFVNEADIPSGRELEYEVKKRGKVRLVWRLPLTQFCDVSVSDFKSMTSDRAVLIPHSFQSQGSLVRILYETGYMLIEKPSRTQSRILDKQRGFAGYVLSGPNSMLYYWFFDRSAKLGDHSSVSVEDLRVNLPNTWLGKAFPVTNSEMRGINGSRSSKR